MRVQERRVCFRRRLVDRADTPRARGRDRPCGHRVLEFESSGSVVGIDVVGLDVVGLVVEPRGRRSWRGHRWSVVTRTLARPDRARRRCGQRRPIGGIGSGPRGISRPGLGERRSRATRRRRLTSSLRLRIWLLGMPVPHASERAPSARRSIHAAAIPGVGWRGTSRRCGHPSTLPRRCRRSNLPVARTML